MYKIILVCIIVILGCISVAAPISEESSISCGDLEFMIKESDKDVNIAVEKAVKCGDPNDSKCGYRYAKLHILVYINISLENLKKESGCRSI